MFNNAIYKTIGNIYIIQLLKTLKHGCADVLS